MILRPKRHYLYALLVILLLTACDTRVINYRGNCGQQTQQFMDYVHSFARDKVNAVIKEGFDSGDTAGAVKDLEELDARASEINLPECNPRAATVKDALRLYMLETKNYFSTVAGRAVYGEGPVQAQLTKMFEAHYAFEIALEDLRK